MQFHKSDSTDIWLMGGLGNQLFQVNFGTWLEQEYSLKVTYNTYLLKKNIVTHALGWSIHGVDCRSVIESHQEFKCEANMIALALSKSQVSEKYASFWNLSGICDCVPRHLFGYFQDKKFLVNTFGLLRLDPYKLVNIPSYELVMHLRGGDMNDKSDAYEYYFKVLDELASSQINIVTDCDDSFKLIERTFQKHKFVRCGGTPEYDFFVCCQARKLITAPSTFSWWAARLGRAKEVIISEKVFASLGSPHGDLASTLRVV
jgi:hypothetical protein